MSPGSDNLVSPPARGNLDGKDIILALKEGLGNIIGIGDFRLFTMGKARFQNLLANRLPIDKQLVNTKSGCHPDGRGNLLFSLDGRYEPAGSVRSPVSVVDYTFDYRTVNNGNP